MGKTILIAEDVESDAALLQQALKAADVPNPTVIVTDGDDVIAYLKGNGRFSDRKRFPFPCLLLLDLKLPRTDGIQVLEWLRGHPDLRPRLVIALTGFQEYRDVPKVYQLGADSFLTKPCTAEDVHNLKEAFAARWDSLPPGQDGRSDARKLVV